MIDLRSDTVTKPTPAMREAMARTEVGNASWGEDPTVTRLEAASAAAVGKEAGLFVPSGTMGNQVAIKVWCAKRLAPEVICEARSHVYLNEAAGVATVAGAQVKPVAAARGAMAPEAVEAAIQPEGFLKPQTALICVENTHNYAGGAVVPLDAMRATHEVGKRHGVPVHLDGARIFNAAAALGVDAREIARHCDSVQFCFSKGLSAPVGSVVCGSKAFVAEARRVRQFLGGALRQAGVIAAPALVGLTEMVKRLPEDHARCRRLHEGVKGARGLAFPFGAPETNILVMDVAGTGMAPKAFTERLAKEGVLFSVISATEVRAVTHNDVDDAGIEAAIAAVRRILS
jgi:threonine aldolase